MIARTPATLPGGAGTVTVPAAVKRAVTCGVLVARLVAGVWVPRVHAQAPAPRAQGWTFTYTAGISAGGRAQPGGDITLDVAVWRGIARITPRGGALRGMTGGGGTILLRSADSVVSIVNPSRRDELRVTMAEFGGAIMGGGPGGGSGGASIPMEVSAVRSAVTPRGAGAPLGTFTTRHVEVDGAYTITVTTPAGSRSLQVTQRQSLDVSRDVERLDPGFRAFADQFIRGFGVPAEVRRKLRQTERGVPAGFPVRSVTSGMTVAGTDSVRTERTATVSVPTRTAVDTATFVVPAGFRITEMSRLLQQRRQP